LPTFTDAGPGEYIADHPFQASRPSPYFGLNLNTLAKDNFPDPCIYDIPSRLGDAPAFGMGTGNRPKDKYGATPGPGAHDPRMESVYPDISGGTFGTVERRHESDEVDPDEPPGPGSYPVRKEYRASDKPSAGLGQAARGQAPGMGPVGFPGPGHYPLPQASRGTSSGVHLPLYGKVEKLPGPGDYDPSDHLGRHASPAYRPLHQTAPRKGPFGDASSGTEMADAALLSECALEIARSAEAMGFGSKQPKKETHSFQPSGPKHTMAGRTKKYEARSMRFDVGFLGTVHGMG